MAIPAFAAVVSPDDEDVEEEAPTVLEEVADPEAVSDVVPLDEEEEEEEEEEVEELALEVLVVDEEATVTVTVGEEVVVVDDFEEVIEDTADEMNFPKESMNFPFFAVQQAWLLLPQQKEPSSQSVRIVPKVNPGSSVRARRQIMENEDMRHGELYSGRACCSRRIARLGRYSIHGSSGRLSRRVRSGDILHRRSSS